jgi:hypothetical protein
MIPDNFSNKTDFTTNVSDKNTIIEQKFWKLDAGKMTEIDCKN